MKMEKLNIQEKKEIEPKLLVNRLNTLFATNDEVNKQLLKSMDQLAAYSDIQDVRKEQVNLYKSLVQNTLGFNPEENKEKDPFYIVSGVELDRVALDKHELMSDKFKSENAFSATTMVVSDAYLKELTDIEVVSEGNSKVLVGFEELENEKFVSMRFFDPLIINKERNWELFFGFTGLTDRNDTVKKMTFNQGTVMLASEPVEQIKTSSEVNNINSKLKDILTWFNHDLLAHSTFLPAGSDDLLDQSILSLANKSESVKRFASPVRATAEKFGSAFAGELWSLHLQESVFKQFVSQRPAIVRYLRGHLDNYIRSVEKAASTIPDQALAADTRDYFLKAYSFGFFRIVDPALYATDPSFSAIYEKYPKLADLGPEERHVRSYTFTNKGLLHKDTKPMSHAEVYKEFTDSYESATLFNSMEVAIKDVLNGRKILTEKEIKEYKHFITFMSENKLKEFLDVCLPNLDIFETILVGHNMALSVECLFEPGITYDTFIEVLNKKLKLKRGDR